MQATIGRAPERDAHLLSNGGWADGGGSGHAGRGRYLGQHLAVCTEPEVADRPTRSDECLIDGPPGMKLVGTDGERLGRVSCVTHLLAKCVALAVEGREAVES